MAKSSGGGRAVGVASLNGAENNASSPDVRHMSRDRDSHAQVGAGTGNDSHFTSASSLSSLGGGAATAGATAAVVSAPSSSFTNTGVFSRGNATPSGPTSRSHPPPPVPEHRHENVDRCGKINFGTASSSAGGGSGGGAGGGGGGDLRGARDGGGAAAAGWSAREGPRFGKRGRADRRDAFADEDGAASAAPQRGAFTTARELRAVSGDDDRGDIGARSS